MTLGGKRGRDRIKREGWGEKRLPAQHGRKDEEEGRSEREGSDAAAAREGWAGGWQRRYKGVASKWRCLVCRAEPSER